uniref:Uncharacterized protein n=1 Tax=Romanomermis culicivorax TaxID=13658 RepID=A0A915I5B7_ROMCU
MPNMDDTSQTNRSFFGFDQTPRLLTLALFFRMPQRLATSSVSINLNSQPSPVQQMKCLQVTSVSSSNKNCHNCIGPEPRAQKKRFNIPL